MGTGRAAALRPELQTISNTTEQNSVHYCVKCDVSDGAAMLDMFAGLARRPMPEKYNHLEEIIADLQALKMQLTEIINEQKAAFDPSQAELFNYKAKQLDDIIDDIKRDITSRGGSLD